MFSCLKMVSPFSLTMAADLMSHSTSSKGSLPGELSRLMNFIPEDRDISEPVFPVLPF